MKPTRLALAALLLSITIPSGAQAVSSTLASTPPMGWNSWNFFADKVTDKDIRAAADLMVSTGMRDAGYVYINIDDTWEGKRDAKGYIHSNNKFPDMKGLADYVHSKGLKLGIYSSPGPRTCGGYEGSYEHEEQDAETYASWGIDFLKYDLCSFESIMLEKAPNNPKQQSEMIRAAYEKMHEAIVKTGRPIVYSLCEYGFDSVWEWGAQVGGNLWRTTRDIHPNYDRMLVIAMAQAGLGRFSGPGHWNDPDMLEVGNGKLTHDENVTHMTMWAILAAPLLAGNNLTTMSTDTESILMNRDVLAIDQDKLGKQADRVFVEGSVEIWARPLADGSTALAIFNFGRDRAEMRDMRLHLPESGFPNGAHARDVWAAKDLGVIQDGYHFTIPKHGVVLLKLTR